MIGDYNLYRPRRLEPGLPEDKNKFFCFVTNHGCWESYFRISPDVSPWALAGWYIPRDCEKYFLYEYLQPVRFNEQHWSDDQRLWCFDVKKDEWFIGLGGDWVIPRSIDDLSKNINRAKVIHEW